MVLQIIYLRGRANTMTSYKECMKLASYYAYKECMKLMKDFWDTYRLPRTNTSATLVKHVQLVFNEGNLIFFLATVTTTKRRRRFWLRNIMGVFRQCSFWNGQWKAKQITHRTAWDFFDNSLCFFYTALDLTFPTILTSFEIVSF